MSTCVVVSGGDRHSLVLDSLGQVWAFGENGQGQLGIGSTVDSNVPVQVSGLSSVVAVSAGYTHSLALLSDGSVWAWGQNIDGALGDGTTNNSTVPVRTRSLTGIVAIAAGGDHSLALDDTGRVWAWGWNADGQLGIGSFQRQLSPRLVSTLTQVTQISAAQINSYAITADGQAWGWGKNTYGGVGMGIFTTREIFPQRVVDITNVVTIAGGRGQVLAITADGRTWSWGLDTNGGLGNGDPGVDSPRPTLVQFDFVPPEQGNVLRAVRASGDVDLEFDGGATQANWTSRWQVFADPDKLSLGLTPLSPVVSATSYLDTGAIGRSGDVYYRVRGASACSGQPGP